MKLSRKLFLVLKLGLDWSRDRTLNQIVVVAKAGPRPADSHDLPEGVRVLLVVEVLEYVREVELGEGTGRGRPQEAEKVACNGSNLPGGCPKGLPGVRGKVER